MKGRAWKRAVALLCLCVFGVLFLLPLYWMITGSFKSQTGIMSTPPEWFPSHPTLRNYLKLLRERPALVWLANSLLVSSVVCVLATLTSATAGYVFGKKDFPGKTFLFWTVIVTMMLPRQGTLIPLYILTSRLGWTQTYRGLIAPFIAFPFGIFLVKQFMQQIPNDLIAAARIDGAGEWGVFRHVILPMARPAMGAVAIFSFVGAWNEYLWQLVMTDEQRWYTLPVGVTKLTTLGFEYDVGVSMAGATLAFLPMLIVFILFQRHFVSGISVGALKG
ncbi:MAG: carbohydrate ABC transporter permease [Planctomycetota bacterium]